MSHFYGTVNGQGKTEATRTGTKKSGIQAVVACWQGSIYCEIDYSPEFDQNCYSVYLRPWKGQGRTEKIAIGYFPKKA